MDQDACYIATIFDLKLKMEFCKQNNWQDKYSEMAAKNERYRKEKY